MITTKIKFGMYFGLLLTMTNVLLAQNLYRWVDDEGNVHYSDKIPPEKSKGAHTKINKQGVVLEQERSAEELGQEALEAKRLEEQRKKEQVRLAKQRRLDQILLDTFTTEKDLLLTRDERLNMIDSIVNLTISNNQIIAKQIEATQTQIKFMETRGNEVPENTRKKLENLVGQREKNLAYIQAEKAERQQLEEQFERDLARYRELRNNGVEKEQAEEVSSTQVRAIKGTAKPVKSKTVNTVDAKGKTK